MACGNNSCGQLGLGVEKKWLRFKNVGLSKNIIDIVSYRRTYILCDDGQLMVSDTTKFTEVDSEVINIAGLNHAFVVKPDTLLGYCGLKFVKIDFPDVKHIKLIRCGMYHSFIVTAE